MSEEAPGTWREVFEIVRRQLVLIHRSITRLILAVVVLARRVVKGDVLNHSPTHDARLDDEPGGAVFVDAGIPAGANWREYLEERVRRNPARRKRERLAVGVMTRDYERSLTKSSVVLFLGLVLVGGYAVFTRDRSMMVVAIITAVFFLLAVLRQAILAWRTAKGFFGSSEHEVRELLAFAMRHPTPDDFYDDNGQVLPAFDLRPEEEHVGVAAGQPIAGTT